MNELLHGGGFHHVAIRATDFEATLRFYIEGMGFRRVHGWGEDARDLGGADSRAALLDTGDGNYLEVFAGRTARRVDTDPEDALLHVAFRTTNCDAALERARAAGAKVTVESKDVLPPNSDRPLTLRVAFVQGPDGEVIEFFQNAEL